MNATRPTYRTAPGPRPSRPWSAVLPFLLAGLAAASCTHDFSEFDVSGEAISNGGSGNGGTQGGDGGDGSVASGGASAGGSADTGGDAGVGGSATGGISNGGGAATGGTSAGGRGGGSGGATGGTVSTGGASSGGTAGTGGAATGGAATGGAATGGAPTGGAGGAGGGTCGTTYGSVAGYILCTEDATTCRFSYTTTTREMCQTLCTAHGGTCMSADNSDPNSCTVVGTATCTSQFTDAVCVCSKP